MVRSTEMQALVVERANGPFIRTGMPRPTPRDHEVLVRVLASGVNPLDTKIRAGVAPPLRRRRALETPAPFPSPSPCRRIFWTWMQKAFDVY